MMVTICNYSTNTHTLSIYKPQAFLVFMVMKKKHRGGSTQEATYRLKAYTIGNESSCFTEKRKCVGVKQE